MVAFVNESFPAIFREICNLIFCALAQIDSRIKDRVMVNLGIMLIFLRNSEEKY